MERSSSELAHAFVRDGFVRLDAAFSRACADACRAVLWPLTGCDPKDRATWKPVVRIGGRSDACFQEAAASETLRAALHTLVGRHAPLLGVGTFPIRFPHIDAPGDDGWHVDTSFPGDDPNDFFSYRANVHSRGRAALLLMLFSDVSPDDAPTRIRVGSHREVARVLAPHGERGLSFMELAAQLPDRGDVALATGEAGTIYVCHPFLAHAAQPHRGQQPRFLAQPPIFGPPLDIERGTTPLERSIREALE
jgi:hypothetical protein